MNKTILASAVTAAMLVPSIASALDTKISGHVNRMIRFADNGNDSDVQFLDNAASQSRFRFNTSGDIGGGITAGLIYEAAFVSSNSSGVDIKDGDGDADSSVFLRHSAIYFMGNFGRVDLGHTTEASDGIAYADLSGTGLGDEVNAGYASAVSYEDGAGTVGDFVSVAGGGRNDLIKYETPNLGGFGVVRASISNASRWGVGAFLGGAAGGGEWQFNLGYGDQGGKGDDDRVFWGGSAAFLFGQGTNITLSYTHQDVEGGFNLRFPDLDDDNNDDDGNGDIDDFYVKLGHKWGNNAASISYGHTQFSVDNADDPEGDRVGVAYVHTMPNSGIEMYAGYHLYMADVGVGSDPDDINVFHVGSRVRFN